MGQMVLCILSGGRGGIVYIKWYKRRSPESVIESGSHYLHYPHLQAWEPQVGHRGISFRASSNAG